MTSLGISARLKNPRKIELVKSQSQSQILANKLRQDGVFSTVENVMQAVDQVAALLASSHVNPNISYKENIINLCQHLKVYGAYLELLYQDQMNRAFVIFRNSSQDDERLDYLSRLHLLELIELRAKGWKGTDIMNQYYRKKANQCVQIEASETASSLSESITSLTATTSLLGPGEVIKSSGKFVKPTRIPGKNYCKDEVVIRNADSGKVNPGAKERLVQITGANEESINHAKHLIEDTIRRNASPVREGLSGPLTGSSSSINSSASEDSALPHSARVSRALLHSLSTNDASLGEYKYTVVVGGHTIKISGDNLDLIRTSKLVLDEYFSGEPIQDITQFYSFDSLPQPILTPELAQSPLSPPESLPSPGLSNGHSDDATTAPLRRPHLPLEDILKGKMSPEVPLDCNEHRSTYSNETLVQLAMSPMCLKPPIDWDRISKEHPNITRKDVEGFDAKQYLSDRSADHVASILSADELDTGEV
ncbi:eukaryotic translation initiation factor 4E-binding protein Mextli isoform X2 [Agrilus planipennis]|uniref:Eukaryotic translation initiation factor 4E-binding protein Mextli isoform X2 n=1 Tax=Agrilus planipennis TaxID=224129 RepID=A0A1W4X284_AGRPL|nr:eukaryotic translation initiation factor 4E-binding protein Mextli isoform X2 [Agrilus planipennis]